MNNDFVPTSRIRIRNLIEKTFQNPGKELGLLTAAPGAEYYAMLKDGKAIIKPQNSISLVTIEPDEFDVI